jgi:hypothetical protein
MIKKCPRCGCKNVKKKSKSANGKQRYECKACRYRFIWKNKKNKRLRERKWFEVWIKEGYSIRQISKISGYSASKIKGIKDYWFLQEPKGYSFDYKGIKYLLFDGTYFNKTNCFMVFMDTISGDIISSKYTARESYDSVREMSLELRNKGVYPISITLDGNLCVIHAIKEIWPEVKIQRCLYHIRRQGQMWLRHRPKTEAGRELRNLLEIIANVRTQREAEKVRRLFEGIKEKHKEYIGSIRARDIGLKDIKKVISLVNKAKDNMFYFLEDKKIAATNNKIEGFFSELKRKYREHRGIKKNKREQYLKWYCYYKNQAK